MSEKMEVPLEAMSSILATKVGGLLYKGEGLKMRYRLFLRTIDQRLAQLQDLSYAPEDLEAFKKVMGEESKLVLENCPAFEKKVCTLLYLGVTMEFDIVGVNDEWSFRLAAKMQTQALSRAELPRLPWESLLFGEGALEGAA